MIRNRKKLVDAKEKCQKALVGEEIVCPSCETKHTKKSYQSVFCKSKGGTKCKDNFWNNVDPKKRKNTTRISPASARFLADKHDSRFESREAQETYHLEDNSSDHGDCHVEPCEYCGMYAGGGCRC